MSDLWSVQTNLYLPTFLKRFVNVYELGAAAICERNLLFLTPFGPFTSATSWLSGVPQLAHFHRTFPPFRTFTAVGVK